ncbi:MAG: DUF1007 family protein [Spirochaetaceae bacterium]|nr:MAG: DUF1007 family protein [Spirochaetaceae bacterium]
MVGGMKLVLMLVLGLFAGTVPIHAHPHVFIDARVTFQFNEREMEGFWVEWHFDPLFTSMIVMDFGAPREGPFSQDVIRVIHDGAFTNLRHYDYFTYVIADDRVHPAEEAREFSAFMRDRRIVYRFFVPFRHPLDERARMVRVRMYDETFFTDIAFASEQPVSVNSPVSLVEERRVQKYENLKIAYDARDQAVRREGAVYTGLTHPWEARLQYRR